MERSEVSKGRGRGGGEEGEREGVTKKNQVFLHCFFCQGGNKSMGIPGVPLMKKR